MRVLIAPDSYKGTLTSVEVARALETGWRGARPDDDIRLAPLADGGEGTLVAIEATGGWRRVEAEVADPLGRPVRAPWLLAQDGRTAVVEMAQASGLSLVDPAERDPVGATSFGTGQLVGEAVLAGVGRIVLGIGGSATTDGGWGLVEALGARLGEPGTGPGAGPGGGTWPDLGGLPATLARADGSSLDLAGLPVALGRVEVVVACDVTNPLLGPDGAAAVYGPQKGATPAQVRQLDARLAAWADVLERATGRRERDTPGAGAAGGVGFAMLCVADRFRSFRLQPGIDLVMETAGFDDALAGSDLVITGEGRIDGQTAFGKTAMGVARRAHAAGVPCIAVGGSVTPDGVNALATVGAAAVPASDPPLPVAEAIAAGAAPLIACGERLARLAHAS